MPSGTTDSPATPAPGAISEIDRCRISGSSHLVSVLNLGEQHLTGVFPRSPEQAVTRGPLELVWCPDSGLLQLKHSYSLEEMYGDNYGYRSGLNASMVEHLAGKVRTLERAFRPRPGDVVVDIGSNDGTLLKSYSSGGVRRIGMDPTAGNFLDHYPPDVDVVTDFFSAAAYREVAGQQRARIVTSIAMFYDLEDPNAFVDEIRQILADDGVWHFEQSYMPAMLRTNSYDTVCHEHIEYYSLQVIRDLLEANGLRIIDVIMNGTNGGSLAVTACHASASYSQNTPIVDWLLQQEQNWGLNSPRPYRDFEERVFRHRSDLQRLVRSLVAGGSRVLGYGASTKGNVLLQFCQFGPDEIPAIAEVNEAKFGALTPGSNIPIVSEAEARAMEPDYFLVLPWHFKNGIIRREQEFLASGGKLIFPLPEIEIVGD